MANRIGSPALGLCLDIGHANVVAGLRRADPMELIEPPSTTPSSSTCTTTSAPGAATRTPPELDPLRLDLHLPPGRGSVPWQRLAPRLRAHPAPLLLEIHPPRPSAAALHEGALGTLGEAAETVAA